MGLFRAKWTDKIHDEWTRNILVKRPDLKPEQLRRTRELMNAAVPDCLVEGFEAIENSVHLPDKADNHVLAAAIHCNADAIITFNLKDFPLDALAPFEIEPQHPDEFIHHQIGLNHAGVLIVWDKLFGTFSAELDEEPVVYGLTKNVGTFHPWTVLVHGYTELASDMRRAERWGDRLRYVFDAPGWSHDGEDKRAKTLRADAGL